MASDDPLETGDGLEGVARDASTILEVLRAFEQKGYTGEFAVHEEGAVECLTCQRRNPAGAVDVRHLRRLEGASDPDDMLALVALACPDCGALGTLVLGYGPAATREDATVLRRLDRPPPPGP